MRRALLILVVLSAFGPYVGSGVRTDQVVVYALALMVIPLRLARVRIPPGGGLLMFTWLLYIAITVSALLAGPLINSSPWPAGAAGANLDNLALPIATLLLALSLAHGRPQDEVRQDVTSTVTLGVSASALVGIAQFAFPQVVAGFVPQFLGAGGTAERAGTLGRFTGVLGQPSAAGAIYSVGLICAIYALRRNPLLQAAAVAVITVGGALTLSKSFLLVGLPLGAWILLRRRGWGPQQVALPLAAGGVAALGSQLDLVQSWSGWDQLIGFLPGSDRATFNGFTGNRYGSGSATQPVIESTLRDHPVFGYGVRGLSTATDTLFVQALVLAGVVGVLLMALVLVLIARAYRRRREALGLEERRLFGPLVLALVVLSVGSPVLTANRVSVVAWALLALMLLSGQSTPGEVSPRRSLARARR